MIWIINQYQIQNNTMWEITCHGIQVFLVTVHTKIQINILYSCILVISIDWLVIYTSPLPKAGPLCLICATVVVVITEAMAGVSYIGCILAAVFILIVSAKDDCSTYTKDTQTGCTIDRGHVVCESRDLHASVRGIPSCTTWITLSLKKLDLPIALDWKLIFASLQSLPHLEKLSITVTQEKYERVPWVRLEDHNNHLNFPTLKILQINADSAFHYKLPASFSSLQVLDLTRSLAGINNAKRFCKTLPAVQKLILRNIQSFARFNSYILSMNLTDFVCIGNVHYLDLSYNDITHIRFKNMCWDIKLQVLILDHNMLTNVHPPCYERVPKILPYLQTIPQLKTLSMDYCSSTTSYHKGLWDDDVNRTNITELGKDNDKNIDHYLSAQNQVLRHTPFRFFEGYEYWLHDKMKHCGNIDFFNIEKCKEHDDLCAFFSCVAPGFNMEACQADKAHGAYEKFSRQFCDFPTCIYNIQIPLPRSLTKITMREFGRYIYHSPRYHRAMHHPNESVYCFDPNNNVEIIDLTNAIFNDLDLVLGQYVVHGLKKLKFLSAQGCHISYVINPLFFSDMESLEELHIGENRLFENDSLPAVAFQSNTKLSILNLSYSNLQGIESDAFINNKHLTVLDLSHNRLDDASLSTLNLSNNNITHLNLSFNALTTLPATVRYHFDQFHDLVLDLSGNNFLCNCKHLDFLQWIQSNTSISFVYAGDHVCSDSPGNTIHTIVVDSLYCNWYWEQPTIAVGCSLLLFFLFFIIFVIHRKRWYIRNLMFHLQERLSWHSDDNTDTTSYRYDAFVLYSSTDS